MDCNVLARTATGAFPRTHTAAERAPAAIAQFFQQSGTRVSTNGVPMRLPDVAPLL